MRDYEALSHTDVIVVASALVYRTGCNQCHAAGVLGRRNIAARLLASRHATIGPIRKKHDVIFKTGNA